MAASPQRSSISWRAVSTLSRHRPALRPARALALQAGPPASGPGRWAGPGLPPRNPGPPAAPAARHRVRPRCGRARPSGRRRRYRPARCRRHRSRSGCPPRCRGLAGRAAVCGRRRRAAAGPALPWRCPARRPGGQLAASVLQDFLALHGDVAIGLEGLFIGGADTEGVAVDDDGTVGLHQQAGLADGDRQFRARRDRDGIAHLGGLVHPDDGGHAHADVEVVAQADVLHAPQHDVLQRGHIDGFRLVLADIDGPVVADAVVFVGTHGLAAVGADGDRFVLADILGAVVADADALLVVDRLGAVALDVRCFIPVDGLAAVIADPLVLVVFDFGELVLLGMEPQLLLPFLVL